MKGKRLAGTLAPPERICPPLPASRPSRDHKSRKYLGNSPLQMVAAVEKLGNVAGKLGKTLGKMGRGVGKLGADGGELGTVLRNWGEAVSKMVQRTDADRFGV
jgi:hypothetical protein